MAINYTGNLHLRIPDLGETGWNVPNDDNTNILGTALACALAGNVVISGCAPSDGGGLDVDYAAGTVVVAGTERTISASSKTATASSLNYLYVDDAGAVQISTTVPTGDFVLLAIVDAGASSLDNVADARNFAEGAAALAIAYDPDNYEPDTGESKEIEQHLAGIDAELGILSAYANKIINGDMRIAQRGTSFAPVASADYTLDRYRYLAAGSMVMNITLSTDVPANQPFTYSMKIAVATAQASLGATDYCHIRNSIEGYDFRPLVGRDCTLSFWVKSNKTGTYCIRVTSSNGDRCYIKEYSITAADTWEKKEIAIPFDYSGGTWDYINGIGLRVYFCLACGSSYHGSAEDWTETGIATSNQTNFCDSTSNELRITGVDLREGPAPAYFQPRLYLTELELCRRYYQWLGISGTSATYEYMSFDVTNGCRYWKTIHLNPPMRSTPDVTLNYVADIIFDQSTLNADVAANNSFRVYCDANGSGRGYISFRWNATAEL